MRLRRALPLLAIGCALLAFLVGRFEPARVLALESGRHALAASAVVLACLAAGRGAILLASKIMRADAGIAIRHDEALLIGFPVLGTIAALVAWTALPLTPSLRSATAALAVIGAILFWRDRPALRSPHRLLILPILLALAMALVPVTSPDELIYKLAAPHAYLLFDRMQQLPLNSHSYATLAPHFTDMASLALTGGIAAKLARFALYLAALAAVHRLARRFTPHPEWVVAILAWSPALALTAGWCWDEWGLIGLVALCLDRWLEWSETTVPSAAAIAFAAAGAAAASKYTALPFLAAFAVVVLIRARHQRRLLAGGALIVAILGGFFYVRNLIWTGSPVAPLLSRDAPPILAYRTAEQWGGWRELMRGSYIFDAGMIDESLGVLLPLAAIAAVLAWRRREMRDLLIVGGIQLPILLTISPIAHNLTAALLPLAIAGGVMLIEIGRLWRIFATIAIVAQAVVIVFVAETYDLDTYLGGKKTAAQYVAGRFDFAAPYEWLRASTPESSRVLLLGETRTFYLERQFIAGGNLDGPRIADWLSRYPSPDSLRSELRRVGVTHVLLRRSGYRVIGTNSRPLTLIEKEQMLEVPPAVDAVVRGMLSSSTLRYRDANFVIVDI